LLFYYFKLFIGRIFQHVRPWIEEERIKCGERRKNEYRKNWLRKVYRW